MGKKGLAIGGFVVALLAAGWTSLQAQNTGQQRMPND